MEDYNKFFSNYELTKKDLSSFVKDNELTQIKLFINSLKPGDILYNYEKILRQLCELPERKVQKGDINLVKRQDSIIQLGRTNGQCRKGRKNSYYWSKLCICCNENISSLSDKNGKIKIYCIDCARKNDCYKIRNPCKGCKKLQAFFQDKNGNKNQYCANCSRIKDCYQKQFLCQNCNKTCASFPDEYGYKKKYCLACATLKKCYKKQNLCRNCDKISATYPDEDGNKYQYCSNCSRKKGCHKFKNTCQNCQQCTGSYPDEDGNKKKYCADCARLKGCYQLLNPCQECHEITGKIKCGHVTKNNNGTYTTTKLNLCVSCAIKLKLYDPKKNQHKSEKRFRKEIRMFVKEQEENEYINLDFENTMFTNCIDNEEICRNKFSLRLDGLLQYRGIYWLLENDEHQHSYEAHYPLSCELDRMMKAINLIRLQGITEPVVFIRFNPDAYHHNGKLKRIGKDKRFQKLKELLRTYTPTQDFEIHYMYYDTIDDCLELQSKNEWVNTLNRFVKKHK